MKVSYTRIQPRSYMVRAHQNRFTRIINQSNTSVPGRTISQIVQIAHEVHASYRDDSRPMAEYVRSECAYAAARINHEARQRVDGLQDCDMVRGIRIPGCSGMWMNMTGLHHISDLYFEGFEIAVDVTAAQIKDNPLFTNCEALLIITEPTGEAFSQALQSIYHNSQWMVMMMGF